MIVQYHSASDIGLCRLNNEDLALFLPKENFCILADGMGGHRAGEVAARAAVEHLCEHVHRASATPHSPKDWKKILNNAIFETNLHVFQMAESHPEYEGMGTTLCVALILGKQLLIGHVGDSRIYRFRKGRLTRLTHDHSLKGELIASGQLDEESAKHYPKKNVITRAIGTQMTVTPELAILNMEPEDHYLLCSDGLTDPVNDAEIAHLLDAASTLEEATAELILAAKKAGGGDNITILSFKVTLEEPPLSW